MSKQMWLVGVAAVLAALILQRYVVPERQASRIQTHESAYERVMRTNTLRCAYGTYPPFVAKDPNTGKLSGLMPDLMAAFEQASGLKVEWGPEIDWGDIATTLQTGKADAFCTGLAATPKRGRAIGFSAPLLYGVLAAFVRPDDRRFDHALDQINQADVRLSVNEGDLSEEYALRLFPKAQRVYKGALGGEDALFLNVAMNKADITLSAPSNQSIFNKNNGTMALRRVELDRAPASFPASIGVDSHETALLGVLDTTLHDLIDNGVVDKLARAHLGDDYGASYVPAKPRNE
jgi:ABC-type amino acid transport substrate-binding protein